MEVEMAIVTIWVLWCPCLNHCWSCPHTLTERRWPNCNGPKWTTPLLDSPRLDRLFFRVHFGVLVVGVSIRHDWMELFTLFNDRDLRHAALFREYYLASQLPQWSNQLQRILLPKSPVAIRISYSNYALGSRRYLVQGDRLSTVSWMELATAAYWIGIDVNCRDRDGQRTIPSGNSNFVSIHVSKHGRHLFGQRLIWWS